LFLIIFIFFVNMFMFGLLNILKSDVLSGVVLGVGILCNVLATVTLGLFRQTDRITGISFKVKT
jgi:hypothetical protein